MRAPSLKTLMQPLGMSLTREQALAVRKLAKTRDDPDALRDLIAAHPMMTRTARHARQCYSDPYDSRMWRTTMALAAMDEVCGTYGVEPLGAPRSMREGPPFEYLNNGDPYTATLLYTLATDTLRVACWGDVVERHHL